MQSALNAEISKHIETIHDNAIERMRPVSAAKHDGVIVQSTRPGDGDVDLPHESAVGRLRIAAKRGQLEYRPVAIVVVGEIDSPDVAPRVREVEAVGDVIAIGVQYRDLRWHAVL